MADESCISWVAHPLRQEPLWKSLALVGCVLGAGALMSISLGSDVYGIISIVVLFAATLAYFAPTHYRIDASGVSWRLIGPRQRRWDSFRRVDRHADGLFLSPFRQPHRLDSFRGQFLRFGESTDPDRLYAFVRAHVAD